MNIITSVGGVRVYGKAEDAWTNPEGRLIGIFPAVFDSDVYNPNTNLGKYFELPCHRGELDYKIHLLESGDAIVFKEGYIYLCTSREGRPQVLTYRLVPADEKDASTR